MYQIKSYAEHNCKLYKGSDSCLPKLAPNSGKLRKLIHNWKKLLIVNKIHPRTATVFRSSTAILLERKRHVYGYPTYVIHIFSALSLFMQITTFFLWFYSFAIDPFLVAFIDIRFVYIEVEVMSVLVDILLMSYSVSCFITGYYIPQTKEVILQPGKIVRRYLRTFFIFDFVGTIHFRTLITYYRSDFNEFYYNLLHCTHMLKFARLKTFFDHFRLLMQLLNFSNQTYVISSFVLLTIAIVHFLTCLYFFSVKCYFFLCGYIQPNAALTALKIWPGIPNVFWYQRYMICVHLVATQFYAAGFGEKVQREMLDQLFMALVGILGAVFYVGAFVVFLLIVQSWTISESKYEHFLMDLHAFMDRKELPQYLKHRILIYYEHRYQKKYFRENVLLSLLSDHLQHEIFLHSCDRLLENVSFFKQLPKAVVGIILSSLKLEVYLPYDVVLELGDQHHCMYFIACGTIAVYNREARELLHIVDGMYFGAPPSKRGEVNVISHRYIAIEMTECYRWEKNEFYKCVNMYKGIQEVLENLATKFHNELRQKELDFEYSQRDVLTNLRMGRILEQGPRRYRHHFHRKN